MADTLNFQVSESLVRPIIEAKISAAIIEAMGGHERMISDMVTAYMNQKVDSEGKDSGYSSNKPRVSYLVDKMLKEAMQAALTTYLQAKTGILEKEFEKFLNSKKGSSRIITAMQDGLCKALTDKWRTNISFSALD